MDMFSINQSEQVPPLSVAYAAHKMRVCRHH